MTTQPLDGYRVLDLTHVLAGPYCTYQLALLGADVVKVESLRGDLVRPWGGTDEQVASGLGTGFVAQNAAKRSLALDLTTEEGQAIALELAAEADILVENYRPGTTASHGLGYDEVRARNPSIIYTTISAFGGTGPLAGRPGFDDVVQATSGYMAMNVRGDGPIRTGGPVLDYATGMQASSAVLAAVLLRQQTGEGSSSVPMPLPRRPPTVRQPLAVGRGLILQLRLAGMIDRSVAYPRRTRRAFLTGAISALFVAGCTNRDDEQNSEPSDPSTITTSQSLGDSQTTAGGNEDDRVTVALPPLGVGAFAALPVCVMTPEQSAGPFPTLDQLDRRDITEGYPGHPLRLGIRVVDVRCEPVPGARVEIWHTDATGDYSAYEDGGSGKDEGPGTTFCRGSQAANDDGIVEFQTIYPGWYEGRAVHIHAMATVDGQEVLTTQLYFDEDYTNDVHATGEYAQFGPPDTGWADDGLIGDPTVDGTGIVLAPGPTSRGRGTVGLAHLGVSV